MSFSAAQPAPLLHLAQFWAYRLAGFAMLNLLDDPAWLAFIFC